MTNPRVRIATPLDRRLQQLRDRYDADAQQIAVALRETLDGIAGSSLPTARGRMAELDAAINSAVSTVMKALNLVRAERPLGRRRVAKATVRRRRQHEKFWTKQLMQLVDLRIRTAWIALDTPGLLAPSAPVTGAASGTAVAGPPFFRHAGVS